MRPDRNGPRPHQEGHLTAPGQSTTSALQSSDFTGAVDDPLCAVDDSSDEVRHSSDADH